MNDSFFEFPASPLKPVDNLGKPAVPNPFFDAVSKSDFAINALVAPYEAVLKGYEHHAEPGRWQFRGSDGYKFHLNVKPEHVQEVAKFLKESDYTHKYLSGGEVEDGKIFTVYTGSKTQTENIVHQVADSPIANLLEPPLTTRKGEILFAPNIAGRFVGNGTDFLRKVAIKGITIVRFTEKWDAERAFNLANKELLHKYGDYYGGGITYYQPSQK